MSLEYNGNNFMSFDDMFMKQCFRICFHEFYEKLRFHNVLEKVCGNNMILFEHESMKA
jgi:hypothetical protein